MKGETQAVHLEKMMQKHKLYPEYELTLPPFFVKSKVLKKLSVDDVLLLGLDVLDFMLMSNGEICAKVELLEDENSQKIKIIYLEKDTLKQADTKKYEKVKCLFSVLHIRELKVGRQLSIEQLNLQEVKLFVNDVYIAVGALIEVDDEIAIQIKRVKK